MTSTTLLCTDKRDAALTNTSLLLLVVLFIINILWFNRFCPYNAITGDNLRYWKLFSESTSFLKTVFYDGCLYKVRPVSNIMLYPLLKSFSYNMQLFFYFNLLFNFLIIYALYKLIIRITRTNTIAFLICLLYLVSRFSLFSIFLNIGILESSCLLFFILILHVSIAFFKEGNKKELYYLTALNFLIIFTHERYVFLLPFLTLLVLKNEDLKIKSKLAFSILLWLPLLIIVLLTNYIFNKPFLMGTANAPITFDLMRILVFLRDGLLSILSLNMGPDHQSGIHFARVNMYTRFFSFAIVSLFLFIFVSFLFNFRKLEHLERKREIRIALLVIILFSSLLLSASITFRQAQRWLYPPYIVLLSYTAYIFTRLRFNRFCKYALLFLLCAFVVRNEIYYRHYWDNVHFMSSNRRAKFIYEETIKKYGPELKNYRIYTVRWKMHPLFFYPYLGNTDIEVNYVKDIKNIDSRDIVDNRVLIFVLRKNHKGQWVDTNLIDLVGTTLQTGMLRDGWVQKYQNKWIDKSARAVFKSGEEGKLIVAGYLPKHYDPNEVRFFIGDELAATKVIKPGERFRVKIDVERNALINFKIQSSYATAPKQTGAKEDVGLLSLLISDIHLK